LPLQPKCPATLAGVEAGHLCLWLPPPSQRHAAEVAAGIGAVRLGILAWGAGAATAFHNSLFLFTMLLSSATLMLVL